MARIHKMDDALDKSKVYEQQLIDYFKNIAKEKNLSFNDTRDDEEYRIKDVDFVLNDIEMEIKCDFQGHKTGNLTYEHISTKIGNRVVGKGCFAKTTAMYIYYYLIHTGEVLEINVENLRRHVGYHFVLGEYVTKEIRNNWNGKVFTGEVTLVPLNSLDSNVVTRRFKLPIIEYKNKTVVETKGFDEILQSVDVNMLP